MAEEVVLKIGHYQLEEQPEMRQNKGFSDANNSQQSSYSSRIRNRECSDDDDDDKVSKCRSKSNASNSMKFDVQGKSRLEGRHWGYERVGKSSGGSSNKREMDNDSFLDDQDVLKDMDWEKDNLLTLAQWASLLLIMVALACTLAVADFKKQTLWSLPLWKWEILILVLICGRLVSGWIIHVGVFFVEINFIRKIQMKRNFVKRTRLLYFVYGVRKSIKNCLWLGLVLIVWHYLVSKHIGMDNKKNGALQYVTKTLVCLLVATFLWLLKTLVIKVLASTFHVSAFFDRIRDSLFKQYVIKKLSAAIYISPIVEDDQSIAREEEEKKKKKNPKLSKWHALKRQIDSNNRNSSMTIDHLKKLSPNTITALKMKRLMRIVQSGVLSTLDEDLPGSSSDDDESSLRIRDECDAKAAAKKIFKNVAKGSKCINQENLKQFLGEDIDTSNSPKKKEDEASKIMYLLGANEISKENLTKWMVEAFKERRSLALSLNDTKTAVDELHHMLDAILAIIIVIIWLFIFDIFITHFLVLVSSQLLLVVFIFGNTCKTIFEGIIFLFVMHPYDVGDRCEINGVQMIVEEMNILTTVFQRYDNQIIIYPHSVLATMPISNYFRSPPMGDAIEFSIHISTPMEKIVEMRKKIIRCIESRSDHWYPKPSVIMTDLEDMNRVKMVVWVTHRMNHQQMGERWARRALLMEEMIKVFRELDIEYRMLPLDMNVRNMPGSTSYKLPSNWKTCGAP